MTRLAPQPSATIEPLLTTEEVAQILRVDPKTVRALVAEEGLRAVRIGKRCIRFDRRDVAAFIDQAKAPAVPSPPPTARVTVRSRHAAGIVPFSERTDLGPRKRGGNSL